IVQLLEENHSYTKRIRAEMHRQRLIFGSIDEGMVGINANYQIDFFNRRAAEMTGISIERAIGKHIKEIIPNSELERIMENGKAETNQEHSLGNGLDIVTSRFPLFDENKMLLVHLQYSKI